MTTPTFRKNYILGVQFELVNNGSEELGRLFQQ